MPHDLLAHGDSEQFWIARVEQTPKLPNSLGTTIYYRQLGQEGKWQTLTATPLPARVVSLASRNGLAAALIDDGSWVLLNPDSGPFTAGPLPGPARMVALAGSANAWWAVGAVPGGIAGLPATRAASQPSAGARAASTQSSTQPGAATQLVLFTLTGNDWTPRGELSDPILTPPAVSLVVIDDVPYLADLISGGVRVRHLNKDRWVTDATVGTLPPLAGFKLLGASQVPRLWVEPLSGPDRIYSLNAPGATMELAAIPGNSPAGRAVAVATGKIRLLGIVRDEVIEQDYGLSSLKPDGAASAIPLPRPNALENLQQYQVWLVTFALVLAILGSFRQRAAMRGSALKVESIPLAPLGRRLAAGLIDALPAILAFTFGFIRFGSAKSVTESNRPAVYLLIYWSAGIFYILWLTVIESIAGRSAGKLLMNLKIIGLDGKPALPGALITRNLLRSIDVGVWFLPLLMIVLMPLRQRAGDVAAGTLVVSDRVIPDAQPVEESAAVTSTPASASTPEQS